MLNQSATISYENITADDLKSRMQSCFDFMLLDVRTPFEHAAQVIKGSYLIPLQELGSRIDELPREKEIVVYCAIGNRSAYVCMLLGRMGFRVKNLEGGIQSWNLAQAKGLEKS